MDIKEIGARLKAFGQHNFNDELEFLTDIRDNIELYTSDKQIYSLFLCECFDNIRTILLLRDSTGKNDFTKSSIICMEIISLLPQNEIISDYSTDIAQLCLHILDRDTDDIGVIAIRNLVFLHKNYTEKLEGVVESFLGFASRLCNDVQHSIPQLIQEVISNRNNSFSEGQEIYIQSGNSTSKSERANYLNDDPDQLFFRGGFSSSFSEFAEITNQVRSTVNRNPAASNVHTTGSTANIILPCHRSLRILIELPLALLHIFQLYPHFIERYFAIFAPNLVSCLNIASLFPKDFHPKLTGSSSVPQHYSINQFQISLDQIPDILRSNSYKSLVQDYMVSCSKIILWFVHFFRGFNNDEHISETLRQTLSGFVQGFIEVLKFCPPYCLHQRREILVCLRSILNTEFRQGFYERIDFLLDETVLVGHGRTGYETVKVLSSAIIHEIMVYLRTEYRFNSFCNGLNHDSIFDSIMKCLHSLTRNILDTALPLPAQHYCIRSAAFLPDILKREGFIPSISNHRSIIIRDVLVNILWVFSLKIHQLRRQIYNLVIVSLNKELPEIPDLINDNFTIGTLKPTLCNFLDEFNEILNVDGWLENSFSYSNTQLGHCEMSILGFSSLNNGFDIGSNQDQQTKPLTLDVLRELRPIIRATIIGARQTIFHITTINRSSNICGNISNKNTVNNNASGINVHINNNANIDSSRYDLRRVLTGVILNETESKLIQNILIEGIICSVEYCQCFQYIMVSSNSFQVKEGGEGCKIIPTSSLVVSNSFIAQSNQSSTNSPGNSINGHPTTTKIQHNSPLSIMPEEKELLELLASIMCYIHPQSFGDIIQATFSILFEWSTTMSPQIALIFHYWGVQNNIAKIFYESILPHLMFKLESLATEPASEFTDLRKSSSIFQIVVNSIKNKAIYEPDQSDISTVISQANSMNMSSIPFSFSVYPTEYYKLALSRIAVDPHIDNVDYHSKIPYSRGRISHFGPLMSFPEPIPIIIDPRDDPNNLIQFAPTAAPHGNSNEHPFPFDILTQSINISLLQIQSNISDLPVPDTFIYESAIKKKKVAKSTGIASGLVTTRLLKQLFRFIGQNPHHETILIPRVVELCTTCTSMASKYKNNIFFLSILRSLFRSITPGGKASGIYKEFLVILPWFLETTIKMQKETNSPFREIWLEISLTVPARLKSLLPYMGQLIDPMLNALESGDPELILLALRSLDLWIDNLHHDFLYPIITNSLYQPHRFQTRPSILITLCKLLRPSPPIPLPISQMFFNNFQRYQKNNNLSFQTLQSIAFQHATLVGRIFGKLGGKNRWFLKDSAILEVNESPNIHIPILLRVNPINNNSAIIFFDFDDTLRDIFQYLISVYTNNTPNYSDQLVKTINLHIKNLLLFYLSAFWSNIGTIDSIRSYFIFLTEYLDKHTEKIENPDESTPFSIDYMTESNIRRIPQSYFKNLELFAKSLIFAYSIIEEISDTVGKYCKGLTNYLAIYSACRSFIPEYCNLSIYWSNISTDPVAPILTAFFDIIDIQSSIPRNNLKFENPSYIALEAIKNMVIIYCKLIERFPIVYYNRALKTAQLPSLLESNIINLCYNVSWSKKVAATMLIVELLNHIPPVWCQTYFQKLSDALFFISKDSGTDSTIFGERCSEDAHDALLYSVFTGIKPVALFGNTEYNKPILRLPASRLGITVTQDKFFLLSGESINISHRNWEDLLTVMKNTCELKKKFPELWWNDAHRIYMEMILTDSRDKWYSGVHLRDNIMALLADNIPSEDTLTMLRKHINYFCMNSISTNILSLKSACRRMAQKCLITISTIMGVSVATLLNINFSHQTTNDYNGNQHSVSQNTLLQQLLTRLQTKLISTCSTPYQLAFLDTLCFIASLRPAPMGIPSAIIRRFAEDIFVVIRDEIDLEMSDNQQKVACNGFHQVPAQVSLMNQNKNPEFKDNRIKVQVYAIRFLKLILLHPNWSEFLRNRIHYPISVPISTNISPMISPSMACHNSAQVYQNSHFQPNNHIQYNSQQTNLHIHQNIQSQQSIPNIQNLNITHQTQMNPHINHQNLQNLNQAKHHYSHPIYPHQTNINQQYQINNQVGLNQIKSSQDELRWKIIGVLFRCVTRKDLEICKAAHHALKVIVKLERFSLNASENEELNGLLNVPSTTRNTTNISQYELLPEDQLRQCLRPVLVHLASATRLNVHVLQGLARLLELLCFCFNVTLGEKLLQHLQRLCWPNDYQQRDILNSNNQLGSNIRQTPNQSSGLANTQMETYNRYEEDLQMAIAMVCAFHLLPQGSDEFTSKVVGTILGTRTFPGIDRASNIQTSISSFITSYTTSMVISSPFRLPLALFATHSPHNVVLFLIQQLASDKYANFLIDLIRMNSCSVIRVKLYQLRTQFIEATVNRVLEETDNIESRRDPIIQNYNQIKGNPIHLNLNNTNVISAHNSIKVPHIIPVSPAFTESYCGAWNGIRVLSSLCEEWPSLLVIDFLEYYTSSNRPVSTIIDTLLTLYNTIFNRLIVFTKTGGISTHGNFDNKFELSLSYQGTVTWQHPWSFFHSNECLMLYKMLIGFYTATNILGNAPVKEDTEILGNRIGDEMVQDIISVQYSMKNALFAPINIPTNSSIGNFSQSSFQRQSVSDDQGFSNNYSFNMQQNRSNTHNANSNIGINSSNSNNSHVPMGPINNITANTQPTIYPSKELIISLLSTTIHGQDVKEHLKRRRIDVILTIATLFGTSSTLDNGAFRDFLICTVPKTLTNQEKRLLFNQLIQRYYPSNPNIDTSSILPGTQLACIQLILIPLLEYEFNRADSCAYNGPAKDETWLNDNVCEGIIVRIILPSLERNRIPLYSTYGLSATDDPLKIEILKLLILIVKNRCCEDVLNGNRKRIIKEVWSILKTESSLLRSWGYITMCYFVRKYPFPEKILFSMLIALTRLYGISEVRLTVRMALKLFIPLLYSLKPITYDHNIDDSTLNYNGAFSLVPSPPKLSVKDKTPEALFSNWLRLMVAILIQDSYNLPLQQQLFHWSIITVHPNIFIYEYIYILPPVISTITKLLWGYNSLNQNNALSQTIAATCPSQNNSNATNNLGNSITSNNIVNVPFLPEMKRNIFDLLFVLTDWVCGLKNTASSNFSLEFNVNEPNEIVKRRRVSTQNNNEKLNSFCNEVEFRDISHIIIDMSSVPQLYSLISEEGKSLSFIELLLTLWFRLALLVSSSDHKFVIKSFKQISRILIKDPNGKVQLSWLDIGFNSSFYNNSNNSSRISIANQNPLSLQGICNQSQFVSSGGFVASQLTLIAGLQVCCSYQFDDVVKMQLDSILRILESAFVSGEKVITDSLFILVSKILQIIGIPSKQLRELINGKIQSISSIINDVNIQNIGQFKEMDFSYINYFRTPLSKQYSTENKVDLFYIRLIDITVSGIWSLILKTNYPNEPNNINSSVQNERNINNLNRGVSLYTSTKLISSFLMVGTIVDLPESYESAMEVQDIGLLILKYLSPLIIYVLDKNLSFFTNFNSQNPNHIQLNVFAGKANLPNNSRNLIFSGPRSGTNPSLNSGSPVLQGSSNSNPSILTNCAELFQIMMISPFITMKTIENNRLRRSLILLLRDYGLISFQGGIIHLIINTIGRWIFNREFFMNIYLSDRFGIEVADDNMNLVTKSETTSNLPFSNSKRNFRILNLDQIVEYYTRKEPEHDTIEKRAFKLLKYEFITTLLTSWSLVCDRNRKFEIHLVYHSFLEEILNNHETEIIGLVENEKISLKSEQSFGNSEQDEPYLLINNISQLEKCAILGLASPHPMIKERFLNWFNKKIPLDIMGRLRYLFTTSNFDILAERFYITQFLELLLPVLNLRGNSCIINNKIRGFPPILPSVEQQIFTKAGCIGLVNDSSSPGLMERELEWWELQDLHLKSSPDEDSVSTSSCVSFIGIFNNENCDASDSPKPINKERIEAVMLEDQNETIVLNNSLETLKSCSDLAVNSLLFFSSTSETLSIKLWKTIFSWIWGHLSENQRKELANYIIDLLSKERHHRISSAMPSEWTVPHVILDSLLACESPPILPSSLLLHLSTKLRCWHIAANYLRNQMNTQNNLIISKNDASLIENKAFYKTHHYVNESSSDDSWMILAQIYGDLQEDDIVIGIRRSFSNCVETHAGLALMQQAEWSKAQEIFYSNLDTLFNSSNNLLGKGEGTCKGSIQSWFKIFESNEPISLNSESMIWIDSWVACAKHLNQWNTLNEFAKERRNPQLQLECSSKLQDWTLVEKLVNKYILHNPVTKLCQAYHSLYDLLLGNNNGGWNMQNQATQDPIINSNMIQATQNRISNANNGLNISGNAYFQQLPQNIVHQSSSRSKLAEFERHCSIGYRTVLNFWAMLPSIVTTCHIPLLLNFQQYIELQEGFRLSSDIERKLYPDGPNSINQIMSSNIHNFSVGSNFHIYQNSNSAHSLIHNSQINGTGIQNSHINNGSHSNAQIGANSSSPGYFEARMLNVWRDRLPNKWDSMILWNDLFVWRNFVFSIIMNLISRSDHLTPQAKSLWPSYLQDMPWTMIKFASIARKSHRLPEVSVALLQRLQNHLQVSGGDAYRAETFLATLEKVKLCLSDITQLRTGLNILNITDFQKCPEPYFDEYRAEFLRLKGIIANKLYPTFYIDGERMPSGGNILGTEHGLAYINNASSSNSSASIVRINMDLLSSLKVYPLFARGWITWAQYTDRLLYIHQNMSYAVNAVISYLMGIYLRPDKYSILLSRVLWLLPHDSPDGKYLSLAFKKYSDNLPCAVWLPWIPQLIAGLDRIEGNALLHILNKIILMFPQSVYFNIRCNYLEKREMAHVYWHFSSGSGNENINQGSSPPPSSGVYPSFISIGWQRIEALMNTCRVRHGALALALEHWIEEVVLHCKPDPLDELLCAIRTLFQMTIEIIPEGIEDENANGESEGNNVKVSDMFPGVGVNFLECNIIRRYEQLLSKPSNTNNKLFERSRSIINQYWKEFKSDFNVYLCNKTSPGIERVPQNLKLEYVLEKLKKWKDHFTKCTERHSIENIHGKTLLSDLSSTLCDLFHRINIRLEVPGQNLRIVSESLYLRNFAVLENPSNNNPIGGVIYLHRSLPIVETVLRQSYTLKRIGFVTSSGSIIHFLIQPYSGLQQKVEERILHLQVTLNTLLYKYKETRSRNISFAILPCIPLHPRCRIIEDTGKKNSLAELFEEEAHANDASQIKDLDIPVLLHRRLLRNMRKKLTSTKNDSNSEEKELLRIYDEICDNWIPENLIKRCILRKFTSYDQSFLFTKQFTTHIGLLSTFSYILGVNDVTPGKLFISTDTGQVYQSELKPSYVSSTLLIDKTEKVPFRLTRNMEYLMGPFGKNGILPGTMLAFAHCLQKYEFHVRNLLCSLLRDDLYSFSFHRALQTPQNRIIQRTNSNIEVSMEVGSYIIGTNLGCLDPSQNSIPQVMHQGLLSNVEIREKVDRNVRRMMEKIAILTNPRPINDNILIDKSVLELIECSTNPVNLSSMKPAWMPWL
ncbi:non-specific serine/threonine protein kinase [Cryptosporidium felis]|nr:non-specific serine/threonine protein kinase [Cryptosporidium felis]